MAGVGAQCAQPLLPPDQPGAQPSQPAAADQAPQNGMQNGMQNGTQNGMQNGMQNGQQNGGEPWAGQTNDQARWQAMVNAPFQGISQPTDDAWIHRTYLTK